MSRLRCRYDYPTWESTPRKFKKVMFLIPPRHITQLLPTIYMSRSLNCLTLSLPIRTHPCTSPVLSLRFLPLSLCPWPRSLFQNARHHSPPTTSCLLGLFSPQLPSGSRLPHFTIPAISPIFSPAVASPMSAIGLICVARPRGMTIMLSQFRTNNACPTVPP